MLTALINVPCLYEKAKVMSMHFVPFRSVFGSKDDGYVKRIDDFAADDDSDDDYQILSVNKPLAKEDERNRKRVATDLLTEVCVAFVHCVLY